MPATETVSVRLELDRDTHAEFGDWSKHEGRNTRDHTAVLMRKLARLRRERPEELARIGLLDGLLIAAQ
ncbi:MAG: hypothetical protein JWO31_4274 [Phycisphaerales bacterium]|nr:hypothetical protein [Phycisphaerales bacterium]